MESKKVTKKEIEAHLKLALEEIGEVVPQYNRVYKCWTFEHSLYPVSYSGNTPEEVIKNFPLYLKQFIKERLQNNLNALTEKQTKGRGGCREGAGRPVGSTKEHKLRIYLPDDIAKWILLPDHQERVRCIMKHEKRIHK